MTETERKEGGTDAGVSFQLSAEIWRILYACQRTDSKPKLNSRGLLLRTEDWNHFIKGPLTTTNNREREREREKGGFVRVLLLFVHFVRKECTD